MRKKVALLVLITLIGSVSAFAQAKAPPKADMGGKTDIAMLFCFSNLVAAASPYDDGFLTGAWLKYWFTEKIGARFLATAQVVPDPVTETSETTLGFSIAGEYHFRPGLVSPYAGGLLALKARMNDVGNYIDFAFGLVGGVEVMLYKNFSLYGEYQALVVRDIEGLGFALGNRAILGFAIYF